MTRDSMRIFALGVFITVLLVLSGACSGNSESTVTTPTPVTTTDTFSGTLVQSGAVVHPFTVTAAGSVTISLTEVNPLATLALGVGIGTWDGATCSSMTNNTNARVGSAALLGTAGIGSYCVRVYDVGNIAADTSVTYTVQVVHP